ncbi:steroid 17-alpha-hydroxylase/17,20 lyase-like [Physella acuta]|uniref:steroid 17-alpha-hydroxylase/17,20 lyase-like n=1 Tax=Physella acuta TaxID=109671 RepID=UPI0027DD76CA|nr:steroid 17-alpha-hydroxylase/17,20 lyase-like [Physella acuta]
MTPDVLELSYTSCALISCVLAGAIVFIIKLTTSSTKNVPPGPRGLSCTWQLLKASWQVDLPELAARWASIYGPLVYFNSGGIKFCHVNTPELARLLLAGDKFRNLTSDRVGNFVSKFTWYNGKDMFFTSYDSITRKKRRLFHKAVAMYGDGVERFEKVVGEELDFLCVELEKLSSAGKDVQMDAMLSNALKYILCILINAERPGSPEEADAIVEYDQAVNQLAAEDIHLVLMAAPWMRFIPSKYRTACQKVLETRAKAESIMFTKMKATYDPSATRGIADVFLQHRHVPGYEFLKDDEHIKGVLTLLFFAAHLTSRATLLNAFLILLNHPEVMRNIQAEIDRVVGHDKPRVENRASMPYTESVTLEVLRYSSFFPLICVRHAKEDLHVENYVIPQGTLILVNVGHFHRDPKYWEDPWTFKPERFLDATGQILPADHPVRKNLLAFGIGNRMCPGEVFARSRVFLFLTRILQKFDLLPPESEPLQSCHPQHNLKVLVRQAPPFKCQIRKRNID